MKITLLFAFFFSICSFANASDNFYLNFTYEIRLNEAQGKIKNKLFKIQLSEQDRPLMLKCNLKTQLSKNLKKSNSNGITSFNLETMRIFGDEYTTDLNSSINDNAGSATSNNSNNTNDVLAELTVVDRSIFQTVTFGSFEKVKAYSDIDEPLEEMEPIILKKSDALDITNSTFVSKENDFFGDLSLSISCEKY